MARFIVPNGCSDRHIRRFISFCFQPVFTWLLQLVFGKINFFPFAFPFVTLITVRAMPAGIFICITDISIFLCILSQDFSCRTVYKISFGISHKISCFCLFRHFFLTSIYSAFFRLFICHFPAHCLYFHILYH